MDTPIADAAQALAGLLRTAEEGDLPAPYSAHADRFGEIDLLVDDLADLVLWAIYLDSVIDDTATPHKGKLHCHARGKVGPFPVRVTALVPELDEPPVFRVDRAVTVCKPVLHGGVA